MNNSLQKAVEPLVSNRESYYNINSKLGAVARLARAVVEYGDTKDPLGDALSALSGIEVIVNEVAEVVEDLPYTIDRIRRALYKDALECEGATE